MPSSTNWERRSACDRDDVRHLDWFSDDAEEKKLCKKICQTECPVRRECLEAALGEEHLWGIWGGVDEYALRRVRAVDKNGKPTERIRIPRCPFCHERDLSIKGVMNDQGFATTCNKCGLGWHMQMIPTEMLNRRARKK